jgi:hypothetical protein
MEMVARMPKGIHKSEWRTPNIVGIDRKLRLRSLVPNGFAIPCPRRFDCFGYTASPCWAASNMDSCSNLSSQNQAVEKRNCFSLPSFLCPSFVWSCSRRYPFDVALGCSM